MKARILAAAVALLLMFSPSAPQADTVDILKSTRALQVQHTEMYVNLTRTEVGILAEIVEVDQHFDNICTVSNINTKKRYWITAAHCVSDGGTYYIEGHFAAVVMYDPLNDLAILQTETYTLPALKLAKRGPKFADRVVVAGHPFGFKDPLLVLGTVANPNWYEPSDHPYFDRPFMIIQAAGAPGNSGSPIVNHKNELVSVLQIGWGRGFSPIMGGVVYEVLKQYANYWK